MTCAAASGGKWRRAYWPRHLWGSCASPGQPQVNPADLAQRAEETVELLRPTIGMNPPADQLVQLVTWLWIDANSSPWQPMSVTASAGPVSSTVTVTPYEVDWDM